MARLSCLTANHKTIIFDSEEHCITCLENEITRLRSYLQRGVDLLRPLSGSEAIDDYRRRANEVLAETLNT